MEKRSFGELRDKIDSYFNEEELKDLCFDLNIDFEHLTGKSKRGNCRELVSYCFRHNKLSELINALKRLRPAILWDEFQTTSAIESKFSFLAQWKPNNNPNGFGADIWLKSELNQEEIISFLKFLTTEFITYANSEDAPILIRLWSSKLAYDQDQERNFGDEFRKGFLVFYVRNLTGHGAYKGRNEIRWQQKTGRFSHLFQTTTKI